MKVFLRLICSILLGAVIGLFVLFAPFGPWLPDWAKILNFIIAIIVVPIYLFNDKGFKDLFE